MTVSIDEDAFAGDWNLPTQCLDSVQEPQVSRATTSVASHFGGAHTLEFLPRG